jgi:DNA-binding transcriptional regulator LsrR (DeoR family)
VLAIELDDLRKVPTVVAVALGAAKGRSMAAAVRGGLLDVIICDEAAARAALSDVSADRSALV